MDLSETRALIAKARDMAAASYGGTSRTLRDLADSLEAAEARIDSLNFELTGARPMARKDNEYLIARAEAAEASLTVPDGDVRERLAKTMFEIYDEEGAIPFEDEGTGIRSIYLDQADAILAAFPVLGRDIAGEIEAERLDTDHDAIGADAYINGLVRAEEIVRNGR